jgi:hypothetical protein
MALSDDYEKTELAAASITDDPTLAHEIERRMGLIAELLGVLGNHERIDHRAWGQLLCYAPDGEIERCWERRRKLKQ